MKEQIVNIKSYPIRLGQFIKLVNIAQDGLEAKIIIQEGQITVNNERATQRGKKLNKGDVVNFDANISFKLM